MAAKIVAAEREVPGKIAATIWARPTTRATVQVMRSLSGRFALHHSAAKIQKPPTTSAIAIGVTWSGRAKPALATTKPSTAVIRKASASLSR